MPSSATSSESPLAPLEWVRPPQQARSKKTFERLLDAAEACVMEQGLAGLTVSAVVARARSSVGAFYARFPDKTALLNVLHERDCTRAFATAEAALDPARWDDVEFPVALEQLVGFCVRLFSERDKLVSGFLGLSATEGDFSDRRAKLARQVSRRFEGFLAAREGEFSHDDPALAATMIVKMVFGTLEAEIAQRNAASAAQVLADADVAAELTRALLGYLGVPVSRWIARSGAGSQEGSEQ